MALDAEDYAVAEWRRDPKASLSDWKLKINSFVNGLKQSHVYHVHKDALSIGPCSSDYFRSLFMNSYKDPPLTEVHLDRELAEAVPAMLDFIYRGDKSALNYTNFLELYQLANLFLVHELKQAAKEFMCWKIDASDTDVMLHFLSKERGFRDDYTQHFATGIILNALSKSSDSQNKLYHELYYDEMLGVLLLNNNLAKGRAAFAPTPRATNSDRLALDWLKNHKNEVTKDMFLELLDEKYVPCIHKGSIALELFKIEQEIVGNSGNEVKRMLLARSLRILTQDVSDLDKDGLKQLNALVQTLTKAEIVKELCMSVKQPAAFGAKPQYINANHHIVVLNACEASMNGIYKHTGVCQYRRLGTWMDRPCIFFIYKPASQCTWLFGVALRENRHVRVCIYKSDPEPGGHGDFCKFPPSTNWVAIPIREGLGGWRGPSMPTFSTPLIHFRQGSVSNEEADGSNRWRSEWTKCV